MYTRCTQCQTIHKLTLEQLREGRGMIQCSHCSAIFDALAQISETEAVASKNSIQDSGALWSHEKRPESRYWIMGACLCLLLLAVQQIVYFEGHAFTQNPKIRPFLAALCEQIKCRLSDYKNTDELNLVGSFSPMPDRNYELRAAISNQADFAQAYPKVKLTLLNYSGSPFAARVFYPREYLPKALRISTIKPDATTEISLKIAAPRSAIGGSTLELVD